jgi:hypothetical protein
LPKQATRSYWCIALSAAMSTGAGGQVSGTESIHGVPSWSARDTQPIGSRCHGRSGSVLIGATLYQS